MQVRKPKSEKLTKTGNRVSLWLDADIAGWVADQSVKMKVGKGTVIRIRLAELFAKDRA